MRDGVRWREVGGVGTEESKVCVYVWVGGNVGWQEREKKGVKSGGSDGERKCQ